MSVASLPLPFHGLKIMIWQLSDRRGDHMEYSVSITVATISQPLLWALQEKYSSGFLGSPILESELHTERELKCH